MGDEDFEFRLVLELVERGEDPPHPEVLQLHGHLMINFTLVCVIPTEEPFAVRPIAKVRHDVAGEKGCETVSSGFHLSRFHV